MSLDAIGIACSDINKSIKFYELLGITFKEFGEGHFEGQTPSGIRIMLDSFELMKKINPNWKEPIQSGVTICFLKETPEEVNELYNKIIESGFDPEKEPWDAFWGQRYSSVKKTLTEIK